MSYIEASETSQRKTGQIKLHGPAGFAGMRKAGALVSKCLDELTDIVKPGVLTSQNRRFRARFRLQPWRLSRHLDVSRLPLFDLHLDQSRGLPRHAGGPGAEGRRHRQYRRHLHRRGLVRRFQPDVRAGRGRAKSRAADRGDLRGDDARHCRGEAGRHHRRHRPRHPEFRRAAGHERGARFLRPRPRAHVPRRAEHHPHRPPRRRRHAEARACSSPSSR